MIPLQSTQIPGAEELLANPTVRRVEGFYLYRAEALGSNPVESSLCIRIRRQAMSLERRMNLVPQIVVRRFHWWYAA